MTRALAIETSSRIGSVAVVRDGVVVVEEQFQHGLQHAAQLVPTIDRLCRDQGWSPADVQHLYVSSGPGSFTGRRIGITLAKTVALATGVKVVGVPTMRVLVENAPSEAQHVVIVLDAKRGQIFTARFESIASPRPSPAPQTRTQSGAGLTNEKHEHSEESGKYENGDRSHITDVKQDREGDSNQWIEQEPAHLGTLSDMLARSPRPVHLLGEGIPYHEQFIPGNDAGIIITPPELWRPRAGVVASIGMQMAQQRQFAEIDRLTPIYLRKPEAEEKYEAKSQPQMGTDGLR